MSDDAPPSEFRGPRKYGHARSDGGDNFNVKKRAPTIISMAAPPNRDGISITRGGEELTVDCGGHLVNSEGRRCDIYGRITKARGAKGKNSRRWDWGRGREWEGSDQWMGSDQWRDTEWEGAEWEGADQSEGADKLHGAEWEGAGDSDESDPWRHWHGCGASSADVWRENDMPIPTSSPQPESPTKSLPTPTSKAQTFGPSPGSPVPSGRGIDRGPNSVKKQGSPYVTEPQRCAFRDVRLKQGGANIEGFASTVRPRMDWADHEVATQP